MAFLNKVMLIGNIGKDPDIKTLQSGKKVVSFSLATSKRYRDNNGEQKEETQWHNIVIWGKTAETFENIGIVKGTQLYIEGEITNRSWTDQTTGQKRYTTEIIVDNLQLLGKKSDNPGYQQPGYAPAAQQPAYAQPAQPSYQPQQPQAYAQPQPAQPVNIANDGPEDDLPF